MLLAVPLLVEDAMRDKHMVQRQEAAAAVAVVVVVMVVVEVALVWLEFQEER